MCPDQFLLHSLVHLLLQPVTECTDQYRLYSPVHLINKPLTECTNWYLLHSLVHLLQQWLQSVLTGTDYTALYTCFSNWLPVVSIYWLPSLLMGYWLHSLYCTMLHPNWLHTHQKKKKKKKISSCLNSLVTSACQFFASYRELLFTVNYRLWRPGTGQSCLR